MKVLASSSLLIGACAASSPLQHVLQAPKQAAEALAKSKPIDNLQKSLKSMPAEARAAWEEVAMIYPEALEQALHVPPPKKHTRKPDSEWDHIIRGADVQSVWVKNEHGEDERDVDGKLEAYDLRTKKVDPSALGVDPNVTQFSGYLDDNDNDKHLFYWFFESRNDPENDPVVLWLNGGPGCSSLTGLFLELGPARVSKKIDLINNPYSWNNNASVIFLDQPVNTGFSYSGSSVSSTIAASKDVYALLTLFFKQFPQYAKQDFHIAGESYAGHYIPVFATEILKHKKNNINLQSILIGNGLTDGYKQYEYYRPMACGDGGWPAVLDESTCQSMDNALPRCQSLISSCYESGSLWTCVPASIYCNNALIGPYQSTGRNPYDIRLPCGNSALCYDELNWIDTYLNQPKVLKALGVEVDSYEGCNFDVNRNFLLNGDWMQPFHRLVPNLLDQIPVLIYAGDADYICNWLGNAGWTDALEWSGGEGYKKVGRTPLKLGGKDDGKKIGEVKSSGNLTFIRIHAAGHMVPYNQPEAGLDFFNRWLSGEWL